MDFTQALHRAARSTPASVATICEGRVKTYSELLARVSRLANGLVSHGVGRGDAVAILSLNSDFYLESYLAIAWIGAVAVPLNFRWSSEELQFALRDSASVVMLVDPTHLAIAEQIVARVGTVRRLLLLGSTESDGRLAGAEQLIAEHGPCADSRVGGAALLGIFYTGGTTGTPKGVMLSHDAFCASAFALLAEGAFPEGAIGLHSAPMFHIADAMMMTCLLLRGGTHVIAGHFRPPQALELIHNYRVTDLLLVPSMLQSLIESAAFDPERIASVRRLMYGASPAGESLLARVQAQLPRAALMQVYGMTEMAGTMTILSPAQHSQDTRRTGRWSSAGRAGVHLELRVVTPDGADAAVREVGEVIARGANMMSGYLNQPEASLLAMRDGWMHTGDMGYLDEDGYLYIVDRLKDMIITGGENVFSVEVEKVIASHPRVAAVAVIGVPCERMGEKVHAAVVVRPGFSLSLEELQNYCKERIAGYKCPRSMELHSELPLSGAGKILKAPLRSAFWRGRSRSVS